MLNTMAVHGLTRSEAEVALSARQRNQHLHQNPPRRADHVPPQRHNGTLPTHAGLMFMGKSAYEFVAGQLVMQRTPQDEIDRAFKLFDLDNDNRIGIDDLRRVAQEIGQTGLEEQELLTMIDEFDYDGTGYITQEVFTAICLQ